MPLPPTLAKLREAMTLGILVGEMSNFPPAAQSVSRSNQMHKLESVSVISYKNFKVRSNAASALLNIAFAVLRWPLLLWAPALW